MILYCLATVKIVWTVQTAPFRLSGYTVLSKRCLLKKSLPFQMTQIGNTVREKLLFQIQDST